MFPVVLDDPLAQVWVLKEVDNGHGKPLCSFDTNLIGPGGDSILSKFLRVFVDAVLRRNT